MFSENTHMAYATMLLDEPYVQFQSSKSLHFLAAGVDHHPSSIYPWWPMMAHITLSMGNNQDDPKEKAHCSDQSKYLEAWSSPLSSSGKKISSLVARQRDSVSRPTENRRSICGDLICFCFFFVFGLRSENVWPIPTSNHQPRAAPRLTRQR